MTAERSRLRNRCEDLLAGFLLGGLKALPRPLAQPLLRGVGSLTCLLTPGRRRHAIDVVCARLAVPRARAKQIVRRSYQGICLNVLEGYWAAREVRRRGDISSLADVEGVEHLQRALESGRGVLLCSAHIGAWELIPVVLSHLARPILIMAKSNANPLIGERLLRMRGSVARAVIAKEDARGLAKAMRGGELLAILTDQRARAHGVQLPFLGQLASQHRVTGMLARRFGAVCLPIYALRQAEGLPYRVVIEPPIEADPALAEAEAEIEVVQRLSSSLEKHVLAQPEQWLWIHDRWRKAERGREVPAPVSASTPEPEQELLRESAAS